MKFKILVIFLVVFSFSFSQNGKILSKEKIDISKTLLWEKIIYNDTIQKEFEHVKKVDFYNITYLSDSLKVTGMMVFPKKKGKFPVIIFNRGGNRHFASLDVGIMEIYTSRLAAEGYVILASNYRKKDEFGGEEVNDVLNLIETAKEIPQADISKIGMFGWSRGGMMTYLSLKKSDKIKTAVVGNGSFNLFSIIKDRPRFEKNPLAECIPNYWNNKEKELKERSVIFWTDELSKNSSLLILAGTKDRRLHYSQTDSIAKKLSEIKYDFEYKKYETDHFFSNKKEELYREISNWFRRKLQ